MFHTAEEWYTNHNQNIDKNGEVVSVRTHDEYFYFTVVTLSTVGYGDISPSTPLGQLIVMIAIIVTIGYFATRFSNIKDWLVRIYASARFARKKLTPSVRVVVSGQLTPQNLGEFLADFLHEDRCNQHLDVVVVGEEAPDRQLRKKFDKYWNVRYCMGSLLNDTHILTLFGKEGKRSDSLVLIADRTCSEF